MASLSKIATNDQHGENSPYFHGWKAYDRNPYHATQNPHGVIQMGLAENQLCFDLIKVWIDKNRNASICTPEGVDQFKEIANFQDYHGLQVFKQAVAKFMSKARGGRVTFDPDRVVMAGGATGANELITFCIADPGDAYLVPTPYYPAFGRDLGWRTGVKIVPVDCYSSNNFQVTRAAVEEAYEKARKANINIKGLLITNPSNPLGTTLERDTLKALVSFISETNIHLVVDEIYAATVFNSPKFISIAEVIEEMDCKRDNIHLVYSLSKDMGFPGFRVGIVYSYNDAVVICGRKMSSFGLVSSQTQYLLASMLSDDEFVDNFLAKSSKRLAKRYHTFTKELQQAGITCLKSNAGLFFWMNLRHLLKEQTVEGEMALWLKIINDAKLNVSPGSSFQCTESGWYRVCFANMDDETVEVALKRIRDFVRRDEETNCEPVKKKCRRDEETNCEPVKKKCRRDEETNCEPVKKKCRRDEETNCEPVKKKCRRDEETNCEPVKKKRRRDEETNCEPVKKKRWQQNNLRLSFSSRIYEESVMSPHRMSPHSPIPQSPLVRART